MLALEVPRKFDGHVGSHRFVPIDGGRKGCWRKSFADFPRLFYSP
jgi:hypothetical protein